jgi:alpha-2-macroglobulin
MIKKSIAKRRVTLLTLGLIGLLTPIAYSQVKPHIALLHAKEQIASKKYQGAHRTLQELLQKHGSSSVAQEAWLLQARALHLQDQQVPSIQSLQRFLKKYPRSKLRKRALHLLAQSYHKVKKFKLAAKITKGELEEVASEAYRLRIARLYLDLADEAYDGKDVPSSTPGQTLRKRDYRSASSFYRQALQLKVPADLHAPVLLRLAECYRALSQHSQAASTLHQIIETYPKSKVIDKAHFERGEALFALSQFENARKEYRYLEKRSPTYAAKAIERLGDSYFANSRANKESRLLGLSHWKRVLSQFGQSKTISQIHWKLADSYFKMGRFSESEKSYRAFLTANDDETKKGVARFRIAESYERRALFEQARQSFGTFLGRHPSHSLFAQAQQRIAQSWVNEGQVWAAAQPKPKITKAIHSWRQFLKRYPVHPSAPEVLYKIGMVLSSDKQFDQAINTWQELVLKYPHHRRASQSQYSIGLVYEKSLNNLKQAIAAYEKLAVTFPYSSEGRNARELLRVMRRQSLRVETPRSFHTEERPVLNVWSRNVKDIRFKAYRLDLEEYFRKKRRINNIEELAVGLVKPTIEWTVKLANSEEFRLVENQLVFPGKGEGAWVVSAETEKFVATSMILVTDIVTVIKRSPDHVLVFAKDRVSGQPAKGVNILLADSQKVLFEGKTNDDGVYQKEVKHSGVRVFAHRNRSYAYAKAQEKNQQSFGYSPKGYVYTDRPIYRPGHTVHYKGIIREVLNGAYIGPKSNKVRVRIFDGQSRILVQEDLKLNSFGSLSGQLVLGREVALGSYTIEVKAGYHTFNGHFDVDEYKKPEILVSVRPKKNSYLSGESISGIINASYYFGGPVPNAALRYTVMRVHNPFDASVHKNNAWFYKTKKQSRAPAYVMTKTGTSNEKGEFEFSFPTNNVNGDYIYMISAEVQGPDRRFIAGAGQVYCTHRGFYALLETSKKVVKPGEAFTMSLKTVQASHEGLATKGELKVLRLSSIGGPDSAESIVQVLPIMTNESGQSEISLKLDRPGDYELRFVGKDRRGTDVEGHMRIVASGEAEDLSKQAKVRAGREVYRRGEDAEILLNSPKKDVYALLTFEGSRVLDYKVIHLKKRSTLIKLPMKDLYAPNVFVKLAIPTEEGFYEDEDEVLVFKYLNVTVVSDKPLYGPEGKAVFTIRTTDQSGQPVSAELSLSLVDEKVYALKSESIGGMKPFFYDQRRKNIVSTAVSSTWAYKGQTREQIRELIEELNSLEREELIKKSLEVHKANSRDQREILDSLKRLSHMQKEAQGDMDGALRQKRRAKKSELFSGVDSPMDSKNKSGWGAKGGLGGKDLNNKPVTRGKKVFALGPDNGGGYYKDGSKGGLFVPAVTKVRRKFADTAFWNSELKTDGDGMTKVEVALPSNLTIWRATARGLTKETLVGDATAQISVTKAAVASIALPRFLTHKDKVTLTASGHNRSDEKLESRMAIKFNGKLVGDTSALSKTVLVNAGQRRSEDVQVSVVGMGEAKVELQFVTPKVSDAVERTIPIKAFGEAVQKGQSGILEDEELWSFDLAANRVKGSARVKLQVFAGKQDALMSGLAYLRGYPYGCVEQTVNRFLPTVAARAALGKLGIAEGKLNAAIQNQVVNGAQRLLALQQGDGGWGWWKSDVSAPFTTAYALMGLEIAAKTRVYVDVGSLQRGRRAAQGLLRRTGDNPDARALLLYALSLSKNGQDDDFNRALRDRDQLSAQGLAWLYLASKGSGRPYNTSALIDDLKATAIVKKNTAHWTGSRRRGWTHENGEATAWAAYAILDAEPESALVEQTVNHLMARQKDGFWRSTKETAAVVFFLAAYLEKNSIDSVKGEFNIEVNGKLFARTKLDGKYLAQKKMQMTVPSGLLKTGKNSIRLVKRGTGKVHYSLALNYVAQADTIKAKGPLLAFQRRFRRFIRGANRNEVPGWSIVRPSARPSLESRPSLNEVISGQRLWVDLRIRTREKLPYVMIEDFLPAGCEIVRGKETGGFHRFEARDDRAVFFVTSLSQGTHQFRYMVQAVNPGQFAVLPTQGGPMYEPEVFAHGASSTLIIHDDPKSLKKAEELTPDELYGRAIQRQTKKQYRKAVALLQQIRKDFKLLANVEEDILSRMLALSVLLKDAKLTVSSYEDLKDLNPRRVNRLSRSVLTQLVLSYDAIGEFQRSHNLGRKVLLSYFEQEAKLADVYRNLGRSLPAQSYMRDLLVRYPESSRIKERWYRLASRYLSISKPVKKGSSIEMPMYATAYNAFKDFCALFPESPLAADAQLSAAEALQRLGDHVGADREASFVLDRHSDSKIREKALILLLRSRYAHKKWDKTFAVGKGLLALRHKQGSSYSKSPFSDEVYYTFAKIHHVNGEIKQAVAFYKKCMHKFNDAADNYRHFTKRGLKIEEVVSAKPGMKIHIPVRSKNMKELKIKIYAVDFMRLFLTRKDLRNIHKVDLTGIPAVVNKTYKLKGARDFSWVDQTISMELKEKGVYLVVGKSEEFDQSSLVVISDLKLRYQNAGGRCKVYVTRNGKVVQQARVKIASSGRIVASGRTDARGVFDGRHIQSRGDLAIIAELDGHYAILKRKK